MKKTKLTTSLMAVISAITVSTTLGQMPSFDEFMAPAADEPSKGIVAPKKLTKPDAVKTSEKSLSSVESKTPVVEAATTQDALIVAEQKLKTLDSDIVQIKVGSGVGYLAKGEASYRVHSNRNASLEDKREAYATAYIKAKANLAKFLYGMTNDSKQELKESIDMHMDSDKDTLVNKKSVTLETIDQMVDGMLRGFVTYEVEDDEKNKVVRVSIVTTPKTQGKTMRAGGVVLAENLRDGMKQVFTELKNGIVAPVGGRVVSVPNGESDLLYFISFGSSVISNHKDAEIARELRIDALEEADMRAAASMCSLIIGDQTSWQRGMNNKTIKESKDFEKVMQTDPTSKQPVCVIKPLDETRKSYVKIKSKTNSYVSAQRGKLPAGLTAQKWISEDGDWAFVAYVYNPYSTAAANKLRKEMQGPSILDLGGDVADHAEGAGNGDGSTKPKKPIGKGPTGKVSPDEDL